MAITSWIFHPKLKILAIAQLCKSLIQQIAVAYIDQYVSWTFPLLGTYPYQLMGLIPWSSWNPPSSSSGSLPSSSSLNLVSGTYP